MNEGLGELRVPQALFYCPAVEPVLSGFLILLFQDGIAHHVYD